MRADAGGGGSGCGDVGGGGGGAGGLLSFQGGVAMSLVGNLILQISSKVFNDGQQTLLVGE